MEQRLKILDLDEEAREQTVNGVDNNADNVH